MLQSVLQCVLYVYRLTIVKDGENSTCEQVTKCISSADSMPVSGDGVQEMMASGEKEKHNDGVLETTLDTSDTAEYYDSTRYEAVSCMNQHCFSLKLTSSEMHTQSITIIVVDTSMFNIMYRHAT